MALNRTELIQTLARVETHAPPTALIHFVDLLMQEDADVVHKSPAARPTTINEVIALLVSAGLCS